MNKIKLGDVIDVKRGTSLSGNYYSTSGDFVRLTLGNFKYPDCGFKLNTSKEDLYFIGEVKPEFIMEKGDIITPLTEQVKGLLGNTATIPESDKYIQSGDIAKIIPDETKVNKRFSYYLVSSPAIKKQLSSASQQTKIRHTSPDKIKDCIAFIPDLYQQKKIAHLLDTFDLLIQTNDSTIEQLESITKTIYDYWFFQFEFPNEDGKPYKSSGGKMVWNDELKREIPEGWTVKTISNLMEISSNKIKPSEIGERIYAPIEVIPKNRMSFYETAPINKATTGLCKFDSKSILLSNRRVYFHKVCISPFDGVTRDTVITMNPKNKNNLGFTFQLVNSNHFIHYATLNSYGTEQPVLSPQTVMEYQLPYPNNELDIKYSSLVNSYIDKVLELERENRTLTELRNFLLPMLMNGQVTIKEEA